MCTLIEGIFLLFQLDDPVFTNRDDFIAGQSTQPTVTFRQLNLWVTCRTAILRWEMSDMGGEVAGLPVTGIAVFETLPAPDGAPFPWLVHRLFAEFNVGLWLKQLGVFQPEC
jgi:hypothetical protein